ncbi:MAG: MaoC family dehydratase [Mangrovicoccus sp.]|nr:MaoC family dehydratase [Mangrovicoccus sp.]
MRTEIGETVFVEDLRIGMSASLTRVLDSRTVESFADVSGDLNPIHLDPAVGAASRFGGCIVHGMLVSSLFSALLANKLPGNGTVYLGQTLKFLAPVPVGAEVTAMVAVSDINLERHRVMLACEAKVAGKLVVTGEATVLAPSRG